MPTKSSFLRSFAACVMACTLGLSLHDVQAQSSARATTTKASHAHAKAAHAEPTSDVYYEIFVRSFYDTDGDGIGDLKGVTEKLDYIKSLGVSGIWLMPINPSPSYHGYDITDYDGINPQYGTMQDFDHLIAEAHSRGIKVVMDMVINHTSNQHPWFKAAQDPKDPHHDWYVWAKPDTDLYAMSATDTPAWHEAGNHQHYLGVFAADMPDLNYDNPAVRQAMIDVGQFWLKKGVDGFRLDAAQHIYDDLKSDMDSPVALQKNLQWWTEYHQALDATNPNVWLVGEVARQDPKDLPPYIGPLNTVFNFPLATQLIKSVHEERNLDIGASLARTQAAYRAHANGQFDDAPFLSNHDQERVMSQLDGNKQHMRVAAALLLTLPGHPFIYYGEELGMRGDKPDQNIREPMRWSGFAAPGTPTWEGWSSGDGPDVSVEAEQDDPNSLLNFYRQLIGLRRQVSALRDGVLRDRPVKNNHVVAYELADAKGRVLVVHNLSGESISLALGAPTARRFASILMHSQAGTTWAGGNLHMPAYATVILR